MLGGTTERPIAVATGWVLVVGIAEVVLLVNALAGVIVHAFIVATILATHAPGRSLPLAAMAMPSLLRIVSLTVPHPQIPVAAWYFLVGGSVLVAAPLVMRADARSAATVGLTVGARAPQLMIAASGIPLGLVLAFAAASSLPSLAPASTSATLTVLLSLGPFVAFPEELVFRGILQRALAEKIGGVAVVLVAVTYASMFLGTRSTPAVLVMACAGLIFGVGAQRSGSIAGTTVAHTIMLIVASVMGPTFT